MASSIPGRQIRIAKYGITVTRNASNLAQTGNLNLFQITGGRVLITTIVGEVTTAIQAQANAVKLQATNASATTDMSGTADVNGLGVGVLFGINGTPSVAALLGASVPQNNEFIVASGFIRMNAAASNTGQMKWLVTYIPLDDGATVVAV